MLHDTITAIGAPTAATVAPGSVFELTPIPKASLPGVLGPAGAAVPPGSMAVVIDDGGPTAFVLAIVDGGSTWVRSDTYGPIT